MKLNIYLQLFLSSVDSMAWLFLTPSSNTQEKSNDLKMELLTKREAEFKELENSQLINIAKK